MLKKLFKIALAREEKSLAEFARDIGVSRQYLTDVLNGRRNSPVISSHIKNYTRNGLRQLHIKLDNLKQLNGEMYL